MLQPRDTRQMNKRPQECLCCHSPSILHNPGALHTLSSRQIPNHRATEPHSSQHCPLTHSHGRTLSWPVALCSYRLSTAGTDQLEMHSAHNKRDNWVIKHHCLQRQQAAHNVPRMLGCSRRQEPLTPPASWPAGSSAPPCRAVKPGEPQQHAAICYPAQASSSSCTGAARSRT